jgi:hypothetical protein
LRIAFLVNWRSGATSGIYRKVAAQARAWTAQGAEVGLFVTTGEPHDWAALPETVLTVPARDHRGGRLVEREIAARAALRWKPSVVYTRHGLAYPGLLRVAARVPLVVEINGDDVAELRARAPWLRPLHQVTRAAPLRMAAGLVFVTHELEASPAFARYKRPSAVIANGIDLAAYTPVPAAPAQGNPHLVMLAHPGSPWHGVDKVCQVATSFPEWQIDLVGPTMADLQQERPANVRLHGELEPRGYRAIVERADVAIGSLALHRAGISEACPLKTREYLALGLPTVIGYRDTDFPAEPSFLLRLPNDEDNIRASVKHLAEFVTAWRGRRVERAEVAHLDTPSKEASRLALMESVLRTAGT